MKEDAYIICFCLFVLGGVVGMSSGMSLGRELEYQEKFKLSKVGFLGLYANCKCEHASDKEFCIDKLERSFK